MNIRSLLVCSALLLFASVACAGSYQRTRDGKTLVWRDVPARGDEATWSGGRDTTIITALLRIKGTRDKNQFEYKAWVSETYVRTPTGWRYVFGQVSKPDAE